MAQVESCTPDTVPTVLASISLVAGSPNTLKLQPIISLLFEQIGAALDDTFHGVRCNPDAFISSAAFYSLAGIAVAANIYGGKFLWGHASATPEGSIFSVWEKTTHVVHIPLISAGGSVLTGGPFFYYGFQGSQVVAGQR